MSTRLLASAEPSLGLKVVWTAAEQFGNLIDLSQPQASNRTSVQGLTQVNVLNGLTAFHSFDFLPQTREYRE